jgi:hypothetical protein
MKQFFIISFAINYFPFHANEQQQQQQKKLTRSRRE